MNASRSLLQTLGLALLLILSPGLVHAESVPATVAYVQGEATYTTPAGKTEKITENSQIPVGSTVTTGKDGSVGLKLVPGATTVVGPDSKLKISSLDYSKSATGEKKRDILLGLTKGSIFSSLAKNDGKSDFRISTPQGVAAARGTDWSVTVSGSTVTVAVLDGNVVITLPNGSTITIPASKVGVSTSSSPVTYIISGLTDDQKNELIKEIEDAGFQLSSQNGPSQGDVYSDQSTPGTLNPANITITPNPANTSTNSVQSPN